MAAEKKEKRTPKSLNDLEVAVAKVTEIREQIQMLVEDGHGTEAEKKLEQLKTAVENVTAMQKMMEASMKSEPRMKQLSRGYGTKEVNVSVQDMEIQRLRSENETLAAEMAQIARAESTLKKIKQKKPVPEKIPTVAAEDGPVDTSTQTSLRQPDPGSSYSPAGARVVLPFSSTSKHESRMPSTSSPSPSSALNITPSEPVVQASSYDEKLSNFLSSAAGNRAIVSSPGLRASKNCILYYNRSLGGDLQRSQSVFLLASFNNWELKAILPDGKDKLQMMKVENLSPTVNGDWWSVSIEVPENAYCMNFVFTDSASIFDNNDNNDFLLVVSDGPTQREWTDEIKPRLEAEAAETKRCKEEFEQAKAEILNLQFLHRNGDLCTENIVYRNNEPSVYSEPSVLLAGNKATVYYNSARTALANSDCVIMCLGHSGWLPSWSPRVTMKRQRALPSDSNNVWWSASFDVPRAAVSLEFAVCNESQSLWDNNDGSNYSLGVKNSLDWDAREKARYEEITSIRHTNEQLEKEKREKLAVVRKQLQAKAMAVLRAQQRFFLQAEPAEPRAGDAVKIRYTPSNTCLNGAQECHILVGFNRWKYGEPELIKMSADLNGNFITTISVPKDCYCMNFCFTDASTNGRWDNKGGLDYTIDVKGGGLVEDPVHVVHISVEMAPIAKVGGLGDVVTSLGRAVQELGHKVEVLLPAYDFLVHSPLLGNRKFEMSFAWGGCDHHVTTCLVEDVRVFFIESMNGYFNTGSVYGRYDDGQRFDFFAKAALEFLLQSKRQPDIVHCHDWSTAMVARYLEEDYRHNGLYKPRAVFTIHNMEYGQAKLTDAATCCQMFTTVSPSYANEVRDSPVVGASAFKFLGVRNGIDMDIWDPSTDKFLPVNYDENNFTIGKGAARAKVQERLGLAQGVDGPLISIISRLTPQKGIHLIKHAAYKCLERGCQFVLLGSAPDPKIQAEFNDLAAELGGNGMGAFFYAYDEPLSHLIYAASDAILVPSMFEPCGLTQLIAMRYGAVPIVRQTGGLYDTVFDVDHDKERAAWELYGSTDYVADGIDGTNGFSFAGTNSGDLDYGLNRAIDAYYENRTWFTSLQKRTMEQDWSWNRPAVEYIDVYRAAMKASGT